MYLSNFALFSVSKNIDISKIAVCVWGGGGGGGGGQHIAILTRKTGLLTVFFNEKRYRSIYKG